MGGFQLPLFAQIMEHLGYPNYFMTVIGFWYVLGGVALLVPRFPRLKEWTYAGLVFLYTGAIALAVVLLIFSFLLLGAMGLSHSLFGARLLPIGTLYDPFIARGLDALNYACYQDARFILVATPSGVALAPEGGAHQSIGSPLIGMAQPGLVSYEPAYADELAVVLRWAFEHIQADGEEGGSVYLRLSTRVLEQLGRTLTPDLTRDIIAGGYWLSSPGSSTRTISPRARLRSGTW